MAGAMRRQGASESVILDALGSANRKQCRPPLDADEVAAIAGSVGKYAPDASATPDQLMLVRASDVESEDVVWRWPGRLPVGKLVILEGDPSVGKSWLSLAITAAVSRGRPLPGDDPAKRYDKANTLLFSAEDGMADTLKPRLEGMKANHRRIFFAGSVGADKHHPNLRADIDTIERAIVEQHIELVIIDPLNGYMSGVDGHRDIDVRTALAPLVEVAERQNVTIIGIRHITKNGADRSIAGGAGSMAYSAAARVVMLVGHDPDDKRRRVVASVKSNLSELPPSLAFEIVDGEFHWIGESDVTADDLNPRAAHGNAGELKDAQEFVSETLADGPLDSRELSKLAKANGIADATLRRAKVALHIKSSRVQNDSGKGGVKHWSVSLPEPLPDLHFEGSTVTFGLGDQDENDAYFPMNRDVDHLASELFFRG